MAAIMIAANVARAEPAQYRKNLLVASTPQPMAAIYVFACDHPNAGDAAINMMFEFTPAGGYDHLCRIYHVDALEVRVRYSSVQLKPDWHPSHTNCFRIVAQPQWL